MILILKQVGDEIEEVFVTATAFDPEAKEADDYDTANTHLKFKVRLPLWGELDAVDRQ